MVNIYAPISPIERKAFFNKLKKWINKYSIYENKIIEGGDFNHTDLNGLDRKTSATTQNDVSYKTLKELCNSIRLVDIWRQMHPNKQQFTYKDISRIDKFLASDNCTNCIQQALFTPAGIKTDHKAVFLNILIDERKKGPAHGQ